jgi:putative sigma-54 modulation protein
MTINIRFIDMPTSEAMREYIIGKLSKLGDKYDWVISANVSIEKLNDAKGKGKLCKIELSLPGPRIYAESDEKNYELSVKETLKDLEVQLKKRKETFKTH